MRKGITWHQLVEWHQAYEVSPFGEERADLRSAMSGAVIANEIRGIAGGLAGKRLQPVQVKDLMIDTDKGRDRAPRSGSSRGKVHDDTRAAQNYYKAWARSIEAKLKEADSATKPKRASKRKR